MASWWVTRVAELADLLREKRLTRISILFGFIVVCAEHATTAVQTPSFPTPSEAPRPTADEAVALAENTVASPMVGIAYLAREPGAAPFVNVGDTVREGDTLLIIEAMKVMNEIRAPRSGRVIRILIEDASPVEYGAPLMVIE